jgi:Geminivirus Rep catalytic domain
MSFAIHGTHFFLTYSDIYPPCHDDDLPVIAGLFNMFFVHADTYHASLEQHDDNSIHCHVYLFYHRIIHSTDTRYFNIGKFHPNIQVVQSTEQDHTHVLHYVEKHDLYIWGDLCQHHYLTKEDVYSLVPYQSDHCGARQIIMSQCPRDYYVAHVNVEKALSSLFPVPPPPLYHSPFVYTSIPHVLDHWYTHAIKDSGCKTALVLYGPTQMRKTPWARSLGPHDYFKGEIDIEQLDHHSMYRVFDDIKAFKKFDIKSWLGGDEFLMGGKYL